jgi:LysR family glycine cleavage system transcriptional activator
LHLFDEVVTPVASPWLVEQARRGAGPALSTPRDLARHTLIVDDDRRPSSQARGWERWLSEHGADGLEPRSRLFHTYAVHQAQSAAAGHGVALARLPLVIDALQRGELVEPFGDAGRMGTPFAYWLVAPTSTNGRPEVGRFIRWVLDQADATRVALASPSGTGPSSVTTTTRG